MENNDNFTIKLNKLSVLGPDWICRHLAKFKKAYKRPELSDIASYFSVNCSHLKPQSLKTLAFGFKKAVKETLGYSYTRVPLKIVLIVRLFVIEGTLRAPLKQYRS